MSPSSESGDLEVAASNSISNSNEGAIRWIQMAPSKQLQIILVGRQQMADECGRPKTVL